MVLMPTIDSGLV
uniref:Uncharacterized protein n=1 Tax=Anguilla anguilla TaxID=7936 RepID=A0A0E9U0X0_ANGAN